LPYLFGVTAREGRWPGAEGFASFDHEAAKIMTERGASVR